MQPGDIVEVKSKGQWIECVVQKLHFDARVDVQRVSDGKLAAGVSTSRVRLILQERVFRGDQLHALLTARSRIAHLNPFSARCLSFSALLDSTRWSCCSFAVRGEQSSNR